jgi:hypothetical protein
MFVSRYKRSFKKMIDPLLVQLKELRPQIESRFDRKLLPIVDTSSEIEALEEQFLNCVTVDAEADNGIKLCSVTTRHRLYFAL